jgi:hypothetical protein
MVLDFSDRKVKLKCPYPSGKKHQYDVPFCIKETLLHEVLDCQAQRRAQCRYLVAATHQMNIDP